MIRKKAFLRSGVREIHIPDSQQKKRGLEVQRAEDIKWQG